MIAKICGTIEEVVGDKAYIMTASGLCYECFITPAIAGRVGTNITLDTYLVVREDALVLFAFDNRKQKYLFEKLIGVDGVGPKMAYSIIVHSPVDTILDAVVQSDLSFFTSIKGVGKKTAQKILIDLSGMIGKEFDLKDAYMSDDETMIIQAMETLGFEKQSIHKILKKLPDDVSVEEKIKFGIRLLTQK